jgi:hypothetical protein
VTGRAEKKARTRASRIVPLVGTVQSATATGFIIAMQGQAFPAYATAYTPAVGENVKVWFIDEIGYVIGPAVPNPSTGVIVSVASSLATITAGGNTITGVPYAAGLALAAGQAVQLLWAGGPFIVAVQSTSAPSATPPPSSSGGATQQTLRFYALDSGSYQSRWWTSQVYASDTNAGAWFYGSKISDTIPASASIQSIRIYQSIRSTNGVAVNYQGHQNYTKPAGAPGFVGSAFAAAPVGGWVSLPNSFASALLSGGGAAGIGLNHGGFTIFSDLSDSLSGALEIVATF